MPPSPADACPRLSRPREARLMSRQADPVDDPPFSRVLARNIDTLVAARREDERRRRLQDRVSDTITQFTGSMRFVVMHALFFGGWIVCNLGWIGVLPRFDPSFV